MFKKHLFLIIAVSVLVLGIVLGAMKLMTGGGRTAGPGGPGGGAGGFAGAPGGGAGGGGFAGGAGGARRGVAVTPATVSVRTFTDTVEVVGAAKARQSVTITAPASQLVTQINFQSGQAVRKGQVLAQLNAAQEDANIVQARSQVALARSNWQRWQGLADKGIAPAATAEQYKAQYDQALATLAANQARAGDRTIRAPFSGIVGLTDAAPGMLLNAGGALVTLDDLSAVRVDFPVPERFLSFLRPGLPIEATSDAYPGTTFQGRIAQLDTRLDPTTRAIPARAEFPNPGNKLRPGMMMRVRIEQATRQNPAVPESAVVYEGGDAFVLVLTPAPAGQGGGAGGFAGRQGGGQGAGGQAGAGGQQGAQAQRQGGGLFGLGGGQRQPGQGQGAQAQGAQGQGGGGQGGPGARQGGFGAAGGAQRPGFLAVRRSIKTGVRAEGYVEVLAGLEAGERVVADGTNRVRANDPVSIVGAGGGRQGQGGAGGFGGGQGGFGGQGGGPRQGGAQGAGAQGAAGATAPAGQRQGGAQAAAGAPAAGGARQGGFGGGGQGGAGGGGFDPAAAFQRADANRDGAITMAEWTGAGRPEQAFSRIDANGDGKITLTEMQARRGPPGGGAGG